MTEGSTNIPPPDNAGKPNKPEPIQPPQKEPLVPLEEGGREYLGMYFTKAQWNKFMAQLMQNALNQVKQDSARMTKALKKLRKSEEDQ